MRVLLLTALLAIPAAAAPVPIDSARVFSAAGARVPVIAGPSSDKSVIDPTARSAAGLCSPTAAQMAADRARKNGGGALLRKLTDLPPANSYVAMYRTVDGCESPIVIRYDVTNSGESAHQ